jgi:hypothetical protein
MTVFIEPFPVRGLVRTDAEHVHRMIVGSRLGLADDPAHNVLGIVVLLTETAQKPKKPSSLQRNRWLADSPLEGSGFEPVWGFSCQAVIFGFPVKQSFLVCWQFFVRSGKAVLRPVAYDQVRGARGRGQGTETLA